MTPDERMVQNFVKKNAKAYGTMKKLLINKLLIAVAALALTGAAAGAGDGPVFTVTNIDGSTLHCYPLADGSGYKCIKSN